jgi:hypothetical protein
MRPRRGCHGLDLAAVLADAIDRPPARDRGVLPDPVSEPGAPAR